MPLLAAISLLAMQTAPTAHVDIDLVAAGCRARLEGVEIAPDALEEQLIGTDLMAPKHVSVVLSAVPETPYRCVAGILTRLFEAEMAGVSIRRSTHPSEEVVRLTLPSWGCAPSVDGAGVAMADLPAMAREWARDERYIDFRAAGEARFECVEQLLHAIGGADGMHLEFNGDGLMP